MPGSKHRKRKIYTSRKARRGRRFGHYSFMSALYVHSTVQYLPLRYVEGGCPGYRLEHFDCTKLNAIGSETIVFCARSVENTSTYYLC